MSRDPIFILTAAAAAGSLLLALAARLHVPSIVLLLLGGFALGPDAAGAIDPAAMGSGLRLVVALAVAVILFEGGMTLDLDGLRRWRTVIRRFLTLGVVITWMGTAAVLWLLFPVDLAGALLAASLVVVTGPTVIAPLLRRIQVRERLHQILYWEAVVVDAIGVFIAVLCFEWILGGDDALGPPLRFAARVGLGAGVGVTAGLLISGILRFRLVGDEYANIVVLSLALFTFGLCEALLGEAGILAVIVAGLVVAVTKPRRFKELKGFKLALTELGIGTLFILLSAKLEVASFAAHSWRLPLAVAILLLVLRPISVLACTRGEGFSVKEKLFLSWIAPRGIVAASMASLVALELSSVTDAGGGHPHAVAADLITAFTFAVIGASVILQGLSAPLVARLLGLGRVPRRTCLLVGESPAVPALARAIDGAGGRALVVLSDSHAGIDDERPETRVLDDLDALQADAIDDPRMADVGLVVSLSDNPHFNRLVCQRWVEMVGPDACFRWVRDRARVRDPNIPGRPLWGGLITPDGLAAGLGSGSLALDNLAAAAVGPAGGTSAIIPLFRVSDGTVRPVEAPEHFQGGTGNVVVARQRLRGLAELVRDAVVLRDPGLDLAGVVHAILAREAGDLPGLAIDEIEAGVVEREQAMPTAVGMGVAIPHAYHPALDRSRCYVAAVSPGLPADTPDGRPIRLVFLVLSPLGETEAHLRALASIARLASDEALLDRLAGQPDDATLLAAIRATG